MSNRDFVLHKRRSTSYKHRWVRSDNEWSSNKFLDTFDIRSFRHSLFDRFSLHTIDRANKMDRRKRNLTLRFVFVLVEVFVSIFVFPSEKQNITKRISSFLIVIFSSFSFSFSFSFWSQRSPVSRDPFL